MIDLGKRNVLGVNVDALDYEGAVARIMAAANDRRPYAVTALAVHGVMTGVTDPTQLYRLNALDLVTPDGQPVRWALAGLHGISLPDRVYGPTLTLELCAEASRSGTPVYFYGSTEETLERLRDRLTASYPGLEIAGLEPSRFRRTTPAEKDEIAMRIRDSGARIVFVGLGCPRQEVFVYEYRDLVGVPLVAVGAAFEYHAGVKREPPPWIQRAGLQWLHRLASDPRRLWKRYLGYNSAFMALYASQRLRLWRPDPDARARRPASDLLYG